MKIRVIMITLVVIIIGVTIFFLLNINFGIDDLVRNLKAMGYECEISNEVSGQSFFPVRPYALKIGEIHINVYEFRSFKQCSDFSKNINYSGFTINGTMISWADTPHFYKKGRLIVQYMGNDVKTIKMLESVLRKQFAGL